MPADAPGLSPLHFLLHVVKPTLAFLGDGFPGIDTDAAAELLIGTAAQESGFRALDQITGPNDRRIGPAFGIFQIEPATLDDLTFNYLRFRPDLLKRTGSLLAGWPSPDMQLVSNLAYATAVARLIYYRSPIKLAPAGDIAGHARVWKAVFNTPAGKGREEDFVRNWTRLVAGRL